MSVESQPGPPTPPVPDSLAESERVLHSQVLSGSETLRNLLSFLARRSLEQPKEPIRAAEIATQVFGRSTDFDSQTDSVVRVHAGRLRSKLAEYYMGEGAEDEIILELPRGSYQLYFRYRGPQPAPEVATVVLPAPTKSTKHIWPVVAGLAVAAGLGFLAAYLLFRDSRPSAPPHLRTLWKDFAAAPEEPLVIFSNPRLIGSDKTGMRFQKDTDDPNAPYVDGYTGVSEVFAVHALSRIFFQMGRSIRVQRGQLVTLDDVRDRNLVLVGGPEANLTLRELPKLQEFNFKPAYSEPNKGVSAITNEHPRPGEQALYWGQTARPYTRDFAIIALIPGLSPGRRVMLMAGIGILGTQAASEYVCREESATELLNALGVRNNAVVPNFEAILEVRGAGGAPVHTRLHIWRLRRNEN